MRLISLITHPGRLHTRVYTTVHTQGGYTPGYTPLLDTHREAYPG